MSDIHHVIIDESQDYSPVHLALIQRLFSGAGFTLLGDLNQAVHPHLHGPPLAQVEKAFGQFRSQIVRLSRSYRNTHEIASFAKAILDAGDTAPEDIKPIERSGPKPKLIAATSESDLLRAVRAGLDALQADGCSSIAIICKTARQSHRVYERLRSTHALTLVTKDDHTFSRGAVVIPSYLSKGLEYDGVIIFDAGEHNYAEESERKLLYTACTRALHRLHLYYTGIMSPLLTDVDPSLYDTE